MTGNGICVVGRANRTGLGMMTLDFCRAMRPDKLILIDVGGSLVFYPEWFDELAAGGMEVKVVKLEDWRDTITPRFLLSGGEVKRLIGFETLYCDNISYVTHCLDIKVICLPNWECSPTEVKDYDCLICLSKKDRQFYDMADGGAWLMNGRWPCANEAICSKVQLVGKFASHLPERFAHNAGQASHNRNGTWETLQAARWLAGTKARLVVRSQFPIPQQWIPAGAPIDIVVSEAEYRADLYRYADVFIHPMQFPGLSLPLIEAAGNRIPSIVLDLPEWADHPHRVPVSSSPPRVKKFAVPVEMHSADVESLGKMMRGMATGEIMLKLPPAPPTWNGFREWWRDEIGPV